MSIKHTHHQAHTHHGHHHLKNDAGLPAILDLLEDTAVEMDDVIRSLEKSETLSTLVRTEAESVVKASVFTREVKSLKHAVALLGLNRLHALLVAQKTLQDQEFHRSA
ncbi:HDOD domain-containing protein [Thalassoglobus polymorphus]|uniref:Uncharacterized protein n=1 Tax=Thalassoglobus polymorphus TaxID=2527994 RepID=A0A517QPN3_9PLAN|nr:HDOD domain-containing protein [Thalassoglobus polymorphus]QDT33589.1 hypothetical protein Mal48_28420 [Thalassoglobus polymorphus]